MQAQGDYVDITTKFNQKCETRKAILPCKTTRPRQSESRRTKKTPCRIPLFKDSPKPITTSQIRRCSASFATMSLKQVGRFNDRHKTAPPTRIPVFKNSPKPINVAIAHK